MDTAIYEYISNVIINSITEDWKSAELIIEASKGFASFEGEYIDSNNEIQYLDVFEFPDDFDEKIKELYQFTHENESFEKWNKAVFTITPDFKFNIEYSIDEEREKLNQ